MAYDKPLKMQWTEINGRAVPLVLPQYWSEEQNDWVVSSTQNRLPVDAKLTGRKVQVRRINASITDTIEAGTWIKTTILPTEGYMLSKIINFYVDAFPPNEATSGTHRVHICLNDTFIYDEVLRIARNFDKRILFRAGIILGEDLEITPNFPIVLREIQATTDVPLVVQYRNDTDADQTNDIPIYFFVVEEAITDD